MSYRIALGQINPTVGDFDGNTCKIIDYIDKARQLKSDLIAFPELSLCGYPPEDLIFNNVFVNENLRYLKKIIPKTKNISVIVGLVHKVKNDIYNAAAFIHNRKLIDFYHKIILPNSGVFDEKRYFKPGNECSVYKIDDTIVGVNICEDIWHKSGPVSKQSQLGKANLVINISASPYHEQKLNTRQKIFANQAKKNKVYIAYVNMVGGQDELVFDGGSMLLGPKGKLVGQAKEFEEDLMVFDIADKKSDFISKSSSDIKVFSLKPHKNKNKRKLKIINNKKLSLEAEIYSALVLGTRDYVYKSGFKKAVLGLSGGIDSALVAAVAKDALGKDNVVVVTMPSVYSSKETQKDSETIARNLGLEWLRVPISDILQLYTYQLRDHFLGRSQDITEENLQARIRSNLLMAFSNKFNWIVLGTGNKSEMSVGYCTLYGDMAAGFAVIKDLPKTMVYKLSKYYNHKSKKEIIPKSVFKRHPSAELKPGQKDEDSLPAYSILDPILREYIENNKSIAKIIKLGFSSKTVKKVVGLVNSSEYKRRQAPIGIKITPRSSGKDRRMPVVNKFDR